MSIKITSNVVFFCIFKCEIMMMVLPGSPEDIFFHPIENHRNAIFEMKVGENEI